MTIDSRTLRDTLGLFVTGVTIITTRDEDDRPIGLTANSFNSVSLDPPLVLWSISNHARSLDAFSRAEHFAVHILRDDQADLSSLFARSGAPKFDGIEIGSGLGGVPVLPDCAACLECSLFDRHLAGDHVIYVAKIEKLSANLNAQPLVYHGGRYASLSDNKSTNSDLYALVNMICETNAQS